MTSPAAALTELLERHRSARRIEPPQADWQQACRIYLEADGKPLGDKIEWEQSCLGSPEETSATRREELAELLEQLKRPVQLIPGLLGLAAWWIKNISEEDPLLERWDSERLQQSLRSIKGINRESADRLALRVFGRPVWPWNRATLRVACRHRWISWEADEEEIQSWFRAILREGGSDANQLAAWLHEIGKQYCGPQPRCTTCPLQPLLPASGPDEFIE